MIFDIILPIKTICSKIGRCDYLIETSTHSLISSHVNRKRYLTLFLPIIMILKNGRRNIGLTLLDIRSKQVLIRLFFNT